jgi:hypothetical protein
MANSFRLVTIPNPAPGANFTYTQPANLMSKVRDCRFLLTNGAAAANRYAIVLARTGGLISGLTRSTQVVTANLVYTFLFIDPYSQAEATLVIAGANVVVLQCVTIWLLPGMTFLSEIQQIQAADQISDIRLLVEDVNLVAPGVVG